ncbi:MAG TPA: xanthine dehydrogenase family protein molybdopterin-binding subunit, partial [Trinickia sp.]|nr:xanthine dehydrogenase family protein molybdopterin-binding subunit [Trinickia sp.]
MNAPEQPGLIGASIKRKEDYRFLTGSGQYTDDVVLPHQTYGAFLRSPHAHARLGKIDIEAATRAPGVVAVFTGADLVAENVGGLPCGWLIHSIDGSPMHEPPHPVLASEKVRHVGDPVALVIAESAKAAKDAAELIEVEYDILPAVTDTAHAADPGQAAVHDGVPGNMCYVWGHGDKAATDAAFANA